MFFSEHGYFWSDNLVSWWFLCISILRKINEMLEPKIGGFSFVIVAVLFIVLLVLLTYIVPYSGSLEPGAPRFFGDSQ
tara:strand:- start:206 stop:439 length:234 start_codon:yes stop_codon:yes gene_type:complete